MDLQRLLEGNGANAVPFIFPGQPDKTVILNTYKATDYEPGKPVVFVQHGMLRNGGDYRDFWIPAAEKHDLLVVAPTFSNADFPEPENYNNGMVLDSEGKPTPAESWIFRVPGIVASSFEEAGVISGVKPRIFGHSAGGQFLHRMVSLCGSEPFEEVVAANAGWYSLPTLDTDFPAGLSGLGLQTEDLMALLATPLHIMAGLNDCEADADNLPIHDGAIAQGPGRLHRARNYFSKGQAKAAELGTEFNWKITEVPGVAHDGRSMSVAAAGIWFEGALPEASPLGTESGDFNA
jgi:hypothetical protein